MSLEPFDATPRTRLVFGIGSAARVGALTAGLGVQRPVLVSDPGIVAAGHTARAAQALEEAGLAVRIFAEVHENPGGADVEACAEAARGHAADGFVALGGGSSIDTARAANIVLCDGHGIASYEGYGKVAAALFPLVAVPTTAGTGSECQSFALISDPSHRKMACGDPKAAARIAILDPALTATQPRSVTAASGLDALVHAIETAVTTGRTPLSLMYSHEAFRRLIASFSRALEVPDDLSARAGMQLGAAFAGLAIEASMLGAAHACANPLTRRKNLVHGHAVATMLPAVVRYNAAEPEAAEAYRALVLGADLVPRRAPPVTAIEALLACLAELVADAGIPSLRDQGVAEEDVAELAAEAATQWTGRFNPRPLTERDFADLYRETLG